MCEQPSDRIKGYDKELTPWPTAGQVVSTKSVRANVINELITAERDYVKLLNDLVDVSLLLRRFFFFLISIVNEFVASFFFFARAT